MGWWSVDILGGDDPYDVAAIIEDRLGLSTGLDQEDDFDRMHMPDDWDAHDQDRVRTALTAYGPERLLDALYERFTDNEEQPIAAQVLGLVLTSSGTPLTPALRDRLLREGCDADVWAKSDPERAEAIARLRQLLQTYDNQPATLPQQGLLEKLGETLGGPGELPDLE